MLSEINQTEQTERDKYHMISLICGILKKKKKAPGCRYKDHIGGYHRQGWKVGKMGKRSQRYKLPVIKQINPMNVMYSIVAIVNNTVLHI